MTSRRRTDRSRTLILQAADRAFREAGIAETSMENIAQEAGLTRKTLYNHFGSKEEIALALIAAAEAADTGYRARMAQNEPAFGLLQSVLLDSAQWCLANPALARLALSPDIRPGLEPPADRPSFQGLVHDLVVLGQGQGVFRTDRDARFMALVVLGVYGQAMMNALDGDSFGRGEIGDLLGLVVEGIGAKGQ